MISDKWDRSLWCLISTAITAISVKFVEQEAIILLTSLFHIGWSGSNILSARAFLTLFEQNSSRSFQLSSVATNQLIPKQWELLTSVIPSCNITAVSGLLGY